MESVSVVEGFDVVEDCQACVLLGFEWLGDAHFGFECCPEGFHGSVVVAIALPAHAALNIVQFEALSELPACILAASVGMHDELFARFVACDGLIECVDDEFGFECVEQGPAFDGTRGQVHECRQVRPPVFRGNVRDICDPYLVGKHCLQSLAQPVRTNWVIMVTIRGSWASSRLLRPFKAYIAHDAGNPVMTTSKPPSLQSSGNTRASVSFPALLVNFLDVFGQFAVGLGAIPTASDAPSVIAATGNTQKLA